MLGARRIPIIGSEPLVSRLAAGLARGGLRTRLVTDARLPRLPLGSLRPLILAAPPAPAALVQQCRERVRQRRPRPGSSLARIVLMHWSSNPPTLPELDPDEALLVEPFAVLTNGARALLQRWPLHCGFDPGCGQRPHLLIGALADAEAHAMAQAYLVQALRQIHYAEEPARVTWLSPDPLACRRRFGQAYPYAGQVAEIQFAAVDQLDWTATPPVTLGYLAAAAAPAAGLVLARDLVDRLTREQAAAPPLLLDCGAVTQQGTVHGWDGQIIPVSLVDAACTAEVLLRGQSDALAASIHEQYRDSIAAQGRDPANEPAGQPWAWLAPSYRHANRHQADHLWAKLAVTDCRAVAEEQVEAFAFAPLEAERLATIEHLRWAADRYLDGWHYAPVRDNARKHHPQLIPYGELSPAMKDLDRFAVRGVPALLARSGLGVARMLILGILEPAGGLRLTARVGTALQRLLTRLEARYPDRALVIATSLSSAPARHLAHLALDQADASLFWLQPEPVGRWLARHPDPHPRGALLACAARAERRIRLAGEEAQQRWVAERAAIGLILGEGAPSHRPSKCVQLTANGGLAWDFEY